MKVLVVGAGNMGKTYIRSFIGSRFIEPSNLMVLMRSPQTIDALKDIPETNLHYTCGDFIKQADIIILAVKPQDFSVLSEQISKFVNADQLVLSVMAGLTTQLISEKMGTQKVVRAMPNLPAQSGMGMTVFTATSEVDRKDMFIIQNLINTTGKSIYADDERMLDAATAVSGSGPAYVYYFMQAMIDAALKMGFNLSQAELLVNQTFLGAVLLHNQGEMSCQQWVEKVASKGGTTEAALSVLENNQMKQGIEDALFAALKRSRDLGNNSTTS